MKVTMTVELTSDELVALLNVGPRPESQLEELLLSRLQHGLPFRDWQPMDVEVKVR